MRRQWLPGYNTYQATTQRATATPFNSQRHSALTAGNQFQKCSDHYSYHCVLLRETAANLSPLHCYAALLPENVYRDMRQQRFTFYNTNRAITQRATTHQVTTPLAATP